MRFKTVKEEDQFKELAIRNPKLKGVLEVLDRFCLIEWGHDICITQVFRTPEEQKELYAQTPNPPTSSPHMFWKAADVRSTDFNDQQIHKMLTLLNCFTYKSGQGRPVAIYHTISGNVFHFHIQCD